MYQENLSMICRLETPRQNYGVRRREHGTKLYKNDSKSASTFKKPREREHGVSNLKYNLIILYIQI